MRTTLLLTVRSHLVFLVAPAVLALAVAGCNDATEPSGGLLGDGTGWFEGTIDPGDGTFVLATVEGPSIDGTPVRVELRGRDLRIDPQSETIRLMVAVRNADRRNLYAPAEIVIHELTPGVVPHGQDWTDCPDVTQIVGPGASCLFGFVYSDLLGEDGILSPGEQSSFREWAFTVPGLGGFSFGAFGRFALDPTRPVIAGVFFGDDNRNGRLDADEQPVAGGSVRVNGPGYEDRFVLVGEGGRYAIPVREPGLYHLVGIAPPTFAPVRFTTPNPLEVILPPGPDGQPRSFLQAHFGIDFSPPLYPPVILINAPGDSVEQDPYQLLDLGIDGEILHLRVGFSGCGPEHPFALFMVGGFMESLPVQVRVILSHDDRDEFCDAYWERDLGFDLRPIRRAYEEAYRDREVIIVNFVDFEGNVRKLPLEPPPFLR